MEKLRHYTFKILILDIIIYILELIFPIIIPLFALNPETITQTPWTIITAMFMHSTTTALAGGGYTINLDHIFQNMVALGLFGVILEKLVGSKSFLRLYLIAGIAGNIAGLIFYPDSTSLGASAAIMGIIGAILVLRPKMVVFFGGPIPIILLALAWMSIDLVGLFVPSDNVGHAAHLAGLAAGMLWASHNHEKYSEKKELEKEIKSELSDEELNSWEDKYM